MVSKSGWSNSRFVLRAKSSEEFERDGKMKLHTLLSNLHSLVEYEGKNPEITSIENDNRKCKAGSLFVCIKGYTVDGHDFAKSAVENGASAILAEHPLDLDVPVIVVTRYKTGDGSACGCILWSSNSKATPDWDNWNKW